MRRKSTVIALLIGLSIFGAACSKSPAGAKMSDDDKHKLFQAVGMAGDQQLALEAAQKMGLVDSSGRPTADFEPFTKSHVDWAMKNADFVREHMSQEKAKEYVKSHMP